MADFRDIMEKIKEIFSVDNLSKPKNKVLLLLIVLAGVPLIMYFSVAAAHTNYLTIAQSPKWVTIKQTPDNRKELNFTINLYKPIARDINSGNYRIVTYNITFVKGNAFYTQPLDKYWLKIENIALSIKYKIGENSYLGPVFTESNIENDNLTFGESVVGQFIFTDLFEDNVGLGSAEWDELQFEISSNYTFYGSEYYNQVGFSEYCSIVETNQLFALNYPQGQRFALQILIIYWVITGLALGAYLFYLNKKKYSFIRPY